MPSAPHSRHEPPQNRNQPVKSKRQWGPDSGYQSMESPQPSVLRYASAASRHNELVQAMDYMVKRWGAFAQFLSDGRICLTNNAAERMLRGPALGQKP